MSDYLTDTIERKDAPVIQAGTVGSKASLTYSIDKDGNLTMIETDDDGNIVTTDDLMDESNITTLTSP